MTFLYKKAQLHKIIHPINFQAPRKIEFLSKNHFGEIQNSGQF